VLCDIEPSESKYLKVKLVPAQMRMGLPEIEVIYRSLLISHINIEREQIHRRESSAAENLEKSWKAVSFQVRLGRGGMVRARHLGYRCQSKQGRLMANM